jgi:hypothetical protein
VDARVEAAPVAPALAGEIASGVLWRAAVSRFLLDVPGVARYLVANGRSITVDPRPGAAPAAVARMLRGTPFAVLCYQRGITVFHAAAAARNNRAVLLAGDSAAGKSVLLAGLLARGWRMLADDLAPVRLNERGQPIVLPTYAELRLWPDAVERLRSDARRAGALPKPGAMDAAGAEGPWSFAVGDRFLCAPQRLRAVWWLSTHSRDRVQPRAIEGAEGFEALGNLTYSSRIAGPVLDRVAHLRTAGAIAGRVPVRRVRRPRGRWSLDELADLVDAGRPGG